MPDAARRLLHIVFGYCDNCHRWFVYPRTRRMSTAYAKESDNYVRCCRKCYEWIESCWEEAWREYYGGLL